MSQLNTHRPLRINLPIPPFPPRQGAMTYPGLSSNPTLKYLANDIENSTAIPQHYHIDPSTFYVKWDRTDNGQFAAAVPEVTALTNDNLEGVLALAEKRNGKDFLFAFAHYWIDRTVYETKWDVQGQAYLAAVTPSLHAAESSNAFALGLDALHTMGTYMHASATMAAPRNTMSGGFSDPRVRAAFEGQVNEVVAPQGSTTTGEQASIFHSEISVLTARKEHHGVGRADQGISGNATSHWSFLSPQEIRDDFHDRARDATARGSIGEFVSSGYLARTSPPEGVDTEGGRTFSTVLGIEMEGRVDRQKQRPFRLRVGDILMQKVDG